MSALAMVCPICTAALLSLAAESRPATSASLQAPPGASAVTCALLADPGLGLADSPLVALLEVRLSEHPGIRLVERREVEKVLAEQKLQAAFAPEATAQRAILGELLKADLLIMLRGRQEGQARVLDAVVSETAGGLRLRVQSAPFDQDASGALEQIGALVDQALLKYREPARQLIAVPPFESGDFLHDRDYLKQTFARVVQELLLAQRSTLVVELEEARAIGKELELAGTERAAGRVLPMYLVGAYRHEGAAESETISIDLSLKQGQVVLKQVALTRLRPEAAVASLKSAVMKLIERTEGAHARTDPDAEVRQLLERAEAFAKTSNWAEALNLVEAAILLQPDRADLHARATELGSLRQQQLEPPDAPGDGRPNISQEEYLLRVALSNECFQGQIEHSLRWVELTSFRQRSSVHQMPYPRGWGFWGRKEFTGAAQETLAARGKGLHKQYQEGMFQALERKVREDDITREALDPFISATEASVYRRDNALRFAGIVQNLPDAACDIIMLFFGAGGCSNDREGAAEVDWLDQLDMSRQLLRPETLEAIEELERMPGVSAQKAAAVLRDGLLLAPQIREKWGGRLSMTLMDEVRETEQEYHNRANWARSSRPAGDVPPDFSLEPINLEISAEAAAGLSGGIIGWQQCQAGVEAVLFSDRICLMTERGRLSLIYRGGDTDFSRPSRADARPHLWFDGQYLWVPASHAETPYIVVVDTGSGASTVLSPSTGLPPTDLGLVVAPYDVGKACVAAAFGQSRGQVEAADRSWCALVTLNVSGPPAVEVILQSSSYGTTSAGPHGESRDDADVVFVPSLLVPLTNPERPTDCRLLLLRRTLPARSGTSRPLLIDPESRQTKLLRGSMPFESNIGAGAQRGFVCAHDGILELLREDHVFTVGFPDFEYEAKALRPGGHSDWLGRPTMLARLGGGYYTIVGGAFWAGLIDGEWRRLHGDLPEALSYCNELVESHYYGAVLLAGPNATWLQPFKLTISDAVLEWAAQEVVRVEAERAAWEAQRLETRTRMADWQPDVPSFWGTLIRDRGTFVVIIVVLLASGLLVVRRRRHRGDTA